MPGLVPGIHVLAAGEDVDGRDIGGRSDAVLRTAIGERSDTVLQTAKPGLHHLSFVRTMLDLAVCPS
jgi:hypothetical protein